MPGKYVLKTVPANTANLTTAIINFLNSEGHKAFRVNTEGQFVPIDRSGWLWDKVSNLVYALQHYKLVVGSFRKSTSESGTADILCCLSPVGIFLAVEVKYGNDTLKKHQKEWLSDIQSRGGVAIVVHSLEEFMTYYQIIKNRL